LQLTYWPRENGEGGKQKEKREGKEEKIREGT
jgi:hypothetical protein